MCLIDTTVWPANGSRLNAAIVAMSQVLAMSSTYFGWVQCPVLQSQTTLAALVKHQHILDNSLLKNSLNFGPNIGLVFTKPESTARDSRMPTQQIRGCTHSNFNNVSTPFSESAAVKTGLVGPLPLIKIADLVGFDDATRPGPSQRTEQQLIEYFGQNFSCCKFFELSPVQIFSQCLPDVCNCFRGRGRGFLCMRDLSTGSLQAWVSSLMTESFSFTSCQTGRAAFIQGFIL